MIKCPKCVKSFKNDKILAAHTNVWHYTRSRKAIAAKRASKVVTSMETPISCT
ncbi:hypothetical protein H4R20_006653 [Coemansia guatemalensis]|uniref:C2H2-type domain-containing protein n=1 Tax=Coemansia guatemalensis TaxID=2761395 RepID=A0A9W8HRV9_9FUNG|nr:hypothetical protein H4R20_006653 [Coemansia guatemalensis]